MLLIMMLAKQKGRAYDANSATISSTLKSTSAKRAMIASTVSKGAGMRPVGDAAVAAVRPGR